MSNVNLISILLISLLAFFSCYFSLKLTIIQKEKDSLIKELRGVIFERDYLSGEYYRLNNELRTTKQFDMNLSQEDIKSIINMIHPDKQPESRKQRANELFIKLRQLQN